MPADRETEGPRDADPPPPFLGSWLRLYILVVAELAATIALLWWLTWIFR